MRRGFSVVAVLCLLTPALCAQQAMSPEMKGRVDAAVKQVMENTGVPSAVVGVVLGGKVAYTAAFGKARLSPEVAATVAMHYPVGSISKQFTAACVLLLVEDGKMRLDDPVAKWFPELTRAKDVTVRMLLSHTSGYSDYAPQDYTIPAWTKPTDPLKLVHEWAEKPLDFEPGTKWQYSNTNFVLTALIIEKVTGQPFWTVLKTRVLDPLGLHEVLNLDTDRARVEPQGTERHALGPLRPAVLEAPGWYFGDATLAMPVSDLLKWDISMIDQKLMKPESYRAMETEVLLKNGAPTGYGLALDVAVKNGHRVLTHEGEVGGFVADNVILPDDHAAIAVLTNQEASGAAAAIAAEIETILQNPVVSNGASPAEAQVKAMLDGLEDGKLDRDALTEDCSFYFSKETVEDFASSLKPLGWVVEVKQTREALRGGMTLRVFEVNFKAKKVNVITYTMPGGKLEQFQADAAE
ncbi:MAG TPA: serine hydrolase domain-containing protein [Acidobacteriaceae bacterium]|nr:serine hydrolase domain-containing protein [Acidobacteriaceae bacterium]